MLCLPEFDTYHILPEYARDPESAYNRAALKVLKHRTEHALQWRLLNCRLATVDNAADLYNFQLGMRKDKKSGKKALDFTKMSTEELMNLWNKAMEFAGIPVDPATLTKDKQRSRR
jgi:hypothetical protein